VIEDRRRPSSPRWLLPAGAAAIALAAAIEYPIVLADFRDVLAGEHREDAAVWWLSPHLLSAVVVVLLAVLLVRARVHALPEKLAIAGAFAFALPIALAPMIWAIYRPMPLDANLLAALRDPHRIQTFTIREKERLLPVTTAAQDEYRPRTARIPMTGPPPERAWMKTPVTRRESGAGGIVPGEQHGDQRRYEASVEQHGTFEAAVFFYPGMRAAVDGVRVAPEANDLGLVSLPLDPGKHTVEIWYGATKDQEIGYGLSALGALLTAVLVLGTRRKRELALGAKSGGSVRR
jgi:hypothetical protein